LLTYKSGLDFGHALSALRRGERDYIASAGQNQNANPA
jgi:hypothetical protein